MIHSARFWANLGGSGTPRWTTKVDWTNDGGTTWTPATFVTGSATSSATSQTRWTSTITLLDVPYGRGGLNPYQTRYRIRQGMVFSDHEEPEWVGLGVYRLATINHAKADPAHVEVTGESFERYLIAARPLRPRTIPAAQAGVTLEALIHEILPAALIDWDAALDRYLVLPKLVSVTDRWNTIDGDRDATSIAKALGARCYHDGDGIWRVESTPSLQDAPAWEATEGPGGVALGISEQLSNEGVTNVEIVVGTPGGSSEVVGPGIARDIDPTSLTYVGRTPDQGGYGEVPADEYQTQLVTSLPQAYKVAQARLASRLGLKQQLTFSVLHDPTKQPGQVGLIHSSGTAQRAILDSVTYDLGAAPGPLQCQTRTTQTRLAGDSSEIPGDQ